MNRNNRKTPAPEHKKRRESRPSSQWAGTPSTNAATSENRVAFARSLRSIDLEEPIRHLQQLPGSVLEKTGLGPRIELYLRASSSGNTAGHADSLPRAETLTD